MDVRQLAFLARQPSAAIQPRERFWGISKRGLAFVLANALFWQPLWAQAGGLAVSGQGTTTTAAANGVPIVNIAAPNARGLSHNQFSDYNVGSQGLILNNATSSTQSTQLGGIILGNSNLKGQAACTILNEVTATTAASSTATPRWPARPPTSSSPTPTASPAMAAASSTPPRRP